MLQDFSARFAAFSCGHTTIYAGRVALRDVFADSAASPSPASALLAPALDMGALSTCTGAAEPGCKKVRKNYRPT